MQSHRNSWGMWRLKPVLKVETDWGEDSQPMLQWLICVHGEENVFAAAEKMQQNYSNTSLPINSFLKNNVFMKFSPEQTKKSTTWAAICRKRASRSKSRRERRKRRVNKRWKSCNHHTQLHWPDVMHSRITEWQRGSFSTKNGHTGSEPFISLPHTLTQTHKTLPPLLSPVFVHHNPFQMHY